MSTTGRGGLARPAISVTLFGLSVHGGNFVIQILLARFFGAGSDVDAFLAANALPQYVISVLVGVMPVIFIPVFAAYVTRGDLDEAYRTARGVVEIAVLVTIACSCVAMAAASPLLQLVTPGLDAATHATAVRLSWIIWPGVIAGATSAFLSAVSNARGRFARAAAAPALAAMINVGLVWLLGRSWGIDAVAAASTAAMFVQLILLLPVLFEQRVERERTPWRLDGVRQIFIGAIPLLASGFLIRANLVIERTLASNFASGAIAHLNYASRISAVVAFVCSTGISTVMFPLFAALTATDDRRELRLSIARGVRMTWLIVAPAIAIGIPLSAPFVRVALEHGRFTAADTPETVALLQIYFLSVAASAVAMITGRAIYALRASAIVATVGAAEAILYIGYTTLLAVRFGVRGVAWGFVVYQFVSTAWQALYLRRRLQHPASLDLARPMLATALAAACSGAIVHLTTNQLNDSSAQLLLGAAIGGLVYLCLLALVNRDEMRAGLAAIRRVT